MAQHLRFALVNGQTQLLCSSPLASQLSGELCLREPGGRGQQSSDAAAISRVGPGAHKISQSPVGTRAARLGTDAASPSRQHKNQMQMATLAPGLQK